MRKTQIFPNMHLRPQSLEILDQHVCCNIRLFSEPHSTNFELDLPDGIWELNNFTEFITDYKNSTEAFYRRAAGPYEIAIFNTFDESGPYSVITVRAPGRQMIENIFQIIEGARRYSTVILCQPAAEQQPEPPATTAQTRSAKPCRNKPRRK